MEPEKLRKSVYFKKLILSVVIISVNTQPSSGAENRSVTTDFAFEFPYTKLPAFFSSGPQSGEVTFENQTNSWIAITKFALNITNDDGSTREIVRDYIKELPGKDDNSKKSILLIAPLQRRRESLEVPNETGPVKFKLTANAYKLSNEFAYANIKIPIQSPYPEKDRGRYRLITSNDVCPKKQKSIVDLSGLTCHLTKLTKNPGEDGKNTPLTLSKAGTVFVEKHPLLKTLPKEVLMTSYEVDIKGNWALIDSKKGVFAWQKDRSWYPVTGISFSALSRCKRFDECEISWQGPVPSCLKIFNVRASSTNSHWIRVLSVSFEKAVACMNSAGFLIKEGAAESSEFEAYRKN
jgi:hypothetical protein